MTRDSLRKLHHMHMNVQRGERHANDVRKLRALRNYDERHNPTTFHMLVDGYTVQKGILSY